MTATPEDIMQTAREEPPEEKMEPRLFWEQAATIRRSPLAESWKRIEERAKAMRAVDDAIERGNQ